MTLLFPYLSKAIYKQHGSNGAHSVPSAIVIHEFSEGMETNLGSLFEASTSCIYNKHVCRVVVCSFPTEQWLMEFFFWLP